VRTEDGMNIRITIGDAVTRIADRDGSAATAAVEAR